MKEFLLLAASAVAFAGCGGPVARLDKLSRVETAVMTDANSLAPDTQSWARPPLRVNDPDRLAALESFLTKRRGTWRKVSGRPRPTRFQLELLSDERPLYTVWMEPGYLALAEGKRVQETRLSNAETAELLACLGLPADYLTPPEMPKQERVLPAAWSYPAADSSPGDDPAAKAAP
jgi:hypothetical protein